MDYNTMLLKRLEQSVKDLEKVVKFKNKEHN